MYAVIVVEGGVGDVNFVRFDPHRASEWDVAALFDMRFGPGKKVRLAYTFPDPVWADEPELGLRVSDLWPMAPSALRPDGRLDPRWGALTRLFRLDLVRSLKAAQALGHTRPRHVSDDAVRKLSESLLGEEEWQQDEVPTRPMPTLPPPRAFRPDTVKTPPPVHDPSPVTRRVETGASPRPGRVE